ncbi:MAG: gamma-glutamyltransferase [Thalassobaculum sp.]
MKGDTVHIDVIDKDGNMFSATPSGGWLQSSPIIPELGFCMGNRAPDVLARRAFALGARAEARGRAPPCRPAFALRDGEPYMAFGTPGGDQQDQWQTLMFLHHARARHEPAGVDRLPGLPQRAFPEFVLAARPQARQAGARGPLPRGDGEGTASAGATTFEVGEDWSEGRLSAAVKDGRMLKAGANPRGMQGYAVGR